MQGIKRLLAAFSAFFARVFHKRSIIVLSEQKVHHIPISGPLQFAMTMAVIAGVCWASYSTGSFMAARTMLKEQDETIRSVASTQVNRSFNYLLSSAVAPSSNSSSTAGFHPMLTDPAYSVTMVDHNKLFERISFLENKVTELKSANDSIIQTVREKTGGQISDLEKIIRNTGLNPDKLKRQAMLGVRHRPKPPSTPDEDNEPAADEEEEETPETNAKKPAAAEGGPFVPADSSAYYEIQERQISQQIDEMMVLGRIIRALPLARPVQNGTMQSNFGRRIDPFNGRLAFHAGLDMSGPSGTKVLATAAGTVVFAGRSGAYGKVVDIDHGFGLMTRYGHLREILVNDGQKIELGEALGIQGSTGRSTGDHVHYEVRYNNKPVNPKNFLDAPYAVLQN